MFRLRSLARAGGCLLLAAFLPSPAVAASFTVSPTQVFLTSKTTSALLTLRNESDETIRFQLSVFKWDQGAGGDTMLLPTDDVVFFPKLVALAAREERKVRIGLSAPFGPIEKTYRVFVEELPPAGKGGPASTGVNMRTRMGIPIFAAPDAAGAGGAQTTVTVEHGRAIVRVENKGAVHFTIDSVRVTGSTAPGAMVFNKTVNGWYVLAGRAQSYEIALTPAECEPAVALAVEVKVGDTVSREHAERPTDGCRAAPVR
jgi:fimbrial chaperone protein